MKLIPLRDRILIEIIDAEETTESGIIIPDASKEKPSQAVVLAVGKGGYDQRGHLVPLKVKPGDRVLFGKEAVFTVEIDQEKFHLLREDNVMAVIGQKS